MRTFRRKIASPQDPGRSVEVELAAFSKTSTVYLASEGESIGLDIGLSAELWPILKHFAETGQLPPASTP